MLDMAAGAAAVDNDDDEDEDATGAAAAADVGKLSRLLVDDEDVAGAAESIL